MWVKYTGKVTYNSMEVRGFEPNTSKSVTEEVGKYLLKTFPKKFSRSGPEVIKEAPKDEVKEEVKEETPKEEKKEEKKK